MKHLLSKSQFLRGQQCRKSLWLYRNRPELRTPPDESQQAIFDAGSDIGLLARKLFPDGTAITYAGSTFEEKIARTKKLIAAGVETIYEATFSHDNVLVMVDILHRDARGWEFYEVKSSTEVKDVHVKRHCSPVLCPDRKRSIRFQSVSCAYQQPVYSSRRPGHQKPVYDCRTYRFGGGMSGYGRRRHPLDAGIGRHGLPEDRYRVALFQPL
jgi:hypothetical protein